MLVPAYRDVERSPSVTEHLVAARFKLQTHSSYDFVSERPATKNTKVSVALAEIEEVSISVRQYIGHAVYGEPHWGN